MSSSQQIKRIWQVRLADEQQQDSPDDGAGGGSSSSSSSSRNNNNNNNNNNNSTRIIRTNVFEAAAAGCSTGTGFSTSDMMMIAPLTASALCRKVVESSGEWLLKICQRHPAVAAAAAAAAACRDSDSNSNSSNKASGGASCCILVSYGCGYATLVLMNGASELVLVDKSSPPAVAPHIPTIWVNAAVASVVVKSEKESSSSGGKRASDQQHEERVQEYGIVSADDAIYDHLAELQRECTEGGGGGGVVRVYLHPTLEAGVVEGSFETDIETCHEDRKRIVRLWTAEESSGATGVVSRIERDLELEKRLRGEGTNPPPSRPTNNKAGVKETKTAAKKKMKASVAAVAKGTKKTIARKAAAAAADEEQPMLNVPPPVDDENPQEIQQLVQKNAPPVVMAPATGPRPAKNKARQRAAQQCSSKVCFIAFILVLVALLVSLLVGSIL